MSTSSGTKPCTPVIAGRDDVEDRRVLITQANSAKKRLWNMPEKFMQLFDGEKFDPREKGRAATGRVGTNSPGSSRLILMIQIER
jgi:hypothetical protein